MNSGREEITNWEKTIARLEKKEEKKAQKKLENEKKISISKKKLKRIMITSATFGALVGTAVPGLIDMIKNGVGMVQHCEQGEQYILKQIEESNILPQNFVITPSSYGKTLQYTDANGVVQFATDESADDLIDEILETALANGIPAEWVEIYFDEQDYAVDFDGVTFSTKVTAKEQAYEQMLSEENSKGVSR